MAATQSALTHRQDASFENAQPSVLLRPSSPTLTNPDMILPDYDEIEPYGSSPVSVWNLTRNVDLGPPATSLPQPFYHAMPLGPATPIIYGNGTMLSDIGEVTEVESLADSPPRRLPSRYHASVNADGMSLRSSPTFGQLLFKSSSIHTAARGRGQSFDSDASYTHGNGRVAVANVALADAGDPISLDDRNFQGDDEQSMASFIEDVPPRGSEAEAEVLAHVLHENRFSSSSLSKRAEKILANAKRRLNNMEGNLSRARNFAQSSASEGSTPSPDPQPALSLEEPTLVASLGHLRQASETGLPAFLRSYGSAPRSASLGGAVGSFRQPLTQSKSTDALITPYVPALNKLSYHPLDVSLKPLGESGHDHGYEHALHAHDVPGGSLASSVASPSPSCYSDASTSLSTSAVQVRDLQNQMQGLKGRISSLREQARADSLKRRSLQGHRMRSPLTYATWDQRHLEPLSMTDSDLGSLAPESPWSGTVVATEMAGRLVVSEERHAEGAPESGDLLPGKSHHEAEESLEEHEALQTPRASAGSVHGFQNEEYDEFEQDPEDGKDEPDGDVQNTDEEGDTDFWSESGESMYHDTRQHPISHEDREYAFDYERFFLYSAMGTISRQGRSRSSSSGSRTSEDSIETTRGPSLSRVRRPPSLDTLTTVESFATAYDDGRASHSSMSLRGRHEARFATPSSEQDKDDGEDADDTPFEVAADSGIGSSGDEISPGRRSRSRQSSTVGSGHDSGEDTSRRQRSRPCRSSAISSVSSSGEETGPWQRCRPRQISVVHRPSGSAATGRALHRPSFSSFESTGTNRSFPLVNKVRMSGGMLTPGSSPEQDLKQVAESLMSETASIYDKDSLNGATQAPAIQMLSKADRIMVERVVASLGRCVLGLTEASQTDAASEDFRRRIDEARKVLEAAN